MDLIIFWSLLAVIACASLRMPLHLKNKSSRLIYTIMETEALDKKIKKHFIF